MKCLRKIILNGWTFLYLKNLFCLRSKKFCNIDPWLPQSPKAWNGKSNLVLNVHTLWESVISIWTAPWLYLRKQRLWAIFAAKKGPQTSLFSHKTHYFSNKNWLGDFGQLFSWNWATFCSNHLVTLLIFMIKWELYSSAQFRCFCGSVNYFNRTLIIASFVTI